MTTTTEPTVPITPITPTDHEAPSRSAQGRDGGPWAGLRSVAADIALPVGTYYALHALGLSDTVALGAGALAAAGRIGVTVLRTRRVTAFSVLMLAVYAVGLGLTFVGGDPHLMLVKDSVGTAVVGIGFLASLVLGRPMILESMRSVRSAVTEDIVRRYATEPAVRRTLRGLTAMWGVGLVVDAVVRVPLVYALPISVGVGVSHALSLVLMALMGVASALVVRHARRAARA